MNALDQNHVTPLIVAVPRYFNLHPGNIGCIKALLKAEAHVNKVNSVGQNTLTKYVAENKCFNREIAKLLCRRRNDRWHHHCCTIPVPVIVLCLSAIFVRNINSSELHFQSVALRSQYSDHAPEAVTLH